MTRAHIGLATGVFLVTALTLVGDRATLNRARTSVRILLLGDSTTIGTICRVADARSLGLEDRIAERLLESTSWPRVTVFNLGKDGDSLEQLLRSGRYDREVVPLGHIDYAVVRYGINDVVERDGFPMRFRDNYATLL